MSSAKFYVLLLIDFILRRKEGVPTVSFPLICDSKVTCVRLSAIDVCSYTPLSSALH